MNPVFLPLKSDYWPQVQEDIKCIQMADTCGVIAIEKDSGELLAAGVADTFSYTGCQVHMLIKNPLILRHKWLEAVFGYIFETCNRHVIVGLVPGDNKKAIKLNKHVGYKEVYRIKGGFNVGVDYVIMEMRREDCRWINQIKEEAA